MFDLSPASAPTVATDGKTDGKEIERIGLCLRLFWLPKRGAFFWFFFGGPQIFGRTQLRKGGEFGRATACTMDSNNTGEGGTRGLLDTTSRLFLLEQEPAGPLRPIVRKRRAPGR